MCRHTKFYLIIVHIGTKKSNLSRLQSQHHSTCQQSLVRTKTVPMACDLKFWLCCFVAVSFLGF